MSYQVLARKWRPQCFEDVIGQKHVVKTLQNAIVNNRIAHSFLFTGQRGVGKTSIARILAKALNCQDGPTAQPCGRCNACKEIAGGNSMDVLEIDGASNTGVDDVRELRESVKYVPSESRYKIYIIDEVHMLSNSAFNALLKTLEEPPAHVIFMFATTEPHKIPATVLSRCQRFDLRRISLEAIAKQLGEITSGEKIAISEQGLRWIAREAEGSLRDAQSILDRVISYAGETIRDEDIVEVLGIVDKDWLMRTSQAIVDKDAKRCLDIVNDLFRLGYDTRQFYHAFLEHLRNLIMIKISNHPARLVELTQHECDALNDQVKDTHVDTLQRLFDVWLKAEDEMNRSSLPQTVLEVTLLKMVYIKRLLPLDDALAKLDDLGKRLLDGKANRVEEVSYAETQNSGDEPSRMKEDAVPVPECDVTGDQKQVWDRLLSFARKEKPMLAAILKHGCLLHLDDGTIELGFAVDSVFLDSAKDTDNKRQLKTICEKFFGRKLTIRISSFDKQQQLQPPLESSRHQNGRGNNVREAVDDALIDEALSIFNGTIVEVKKEDLVTD